MKQKSDKQRGDLLYGLHGTSLRAAQDILAHGWSVNAAASLFYPRRRGDFSYIYAYWGRELKELVDKYLWAAQRWAEEAAERHQAIRPLKSAVLLFQTFSDKIIPEIEPLVHYENVKPIGIIATGVEMPHEHDWNEEPDFCLKCYQEPVMKWNLDESLINQLLSKTLT